MATITVEETRADFGELVDRISAVSAEIELAEVAARDGLCLHGEAIAIVLANAREVLDGALETAESLSTRVARGLEVAR